jgi:hypothetical protein
MIVGIRLGCIAMYDMLDAYKSFTGKPQDRYLDIKGRITLNLILDR